MIVAPSPISIRRAARLLAVVLGLATLACATTHNDLEPDGPRFEGSHAPPVPPAAAPSPGE